MTRSAGPGVLAVVAVGCRPGGAGQAGRMRPSPRPAPRPGQTPGDTDREDRAHTGPFPGLPVVERAELLYEETEQLKQALERRPVIDVARSVLMASWSCTEEKAWQILVRVSQHANTKLYDVVATTHDLALAS